VCCIGFAEDDVVLEVVMLIGTMTADPDAASALANARLVRLLYDVLNEK
jgi:hypothetical protein